MNKIEIRTNKKKHHSAKAIDNSLLLTFGVDERLPSKDDKAAMLTMHAEELFDNCSLTNTNVAAGTYFEHIGPTAEHLDPKYRKGRGNNRTDIREKIESNN